MLKSLLVLPLDSVLGIFPLHADWATCKPPARLSWNFSACGCAPGAGCWESAQHHGRASRMKPCPARARALAQKLLHVSTRQGIRNQEWRAFRDFSLPSLCCSALCFSYFTRGKIAALWWRKPRCLKHLDIASQSITGGGTEQEFLRFEFLPLITDIFSIKNWDSAVICDSRSWSGQK